MPAAKNGPKTAAQKRFEKEVQNRIKMEAQKRIKMTAQKWLKKKKVFDLRFFQKLKSFFWKTGDAFIKILDASPELIKPSQREKASKTKWKTIFFERLLKNGIENCQKGKSIWWKIEGVLGKIFGCQKQNKMAAASYRIGSRDSKTGRRCYNKGSQTRGAIDSKFWRCCGPKIVGLAVRWPKRWVQKKVHKYEFETPPVDNLLTRKTKFANWKNIFSKNWKIKLDQNWIFSPAKSKTTRALYLLLEEPGRPRCGAFSRWSDTKAHYCTAGAQYRASAKSLRRNFAKNINCFTNLKANGCPWAGGRKSRWTFRP